MNDKNVYNKEIQDVVKTELRMDEVHENLKPQIQIRFKKMQLK